MSLNISVRGTIPARAWVHILAGDKRGELRVRNGINVKDIGGVSQAPRLRQNGTAGGCTWWTCTTCPSGKSRQPRNAVRLTALPNCPHSPALSVSVSSCHAGVFNSLHITVNLIEAADRSSHLRGIDATTCRGQK